MGLKQTHQAVRLNLQEVRAHRLDVLAARANALNSIADQVNAQVVGLQSSVQSSSEQQRRLEGTLQQSQDSIRSQLEHMHEVLSETDKELEGLEERKRHLKVELDETSKQVDVARARQDQQMEARVKEWTILDASRSHSEDKITAENKALEEAEHRRATL